MKFSDLLKEAISTADVELDAQEVEAVVEPILELLNAWIAIHEPDEDPSNASDPQRALVLQLMEELADRVPIPIVS